MPDRNELLQIRQMGVSELEHMQAQASARRMHEFEERCREVLEKLDMRLRVAAAEQYLARIFHLPP